MAKQKLKKKEVGFTQIKNDVLENPKLSLRAKGMFCYLYSKPDDWEFSSERIVKVSSDGSRSTISAIKELEKAGYLTRKRLPTGKVEYFITYEPHVHSAQEASEPVVRNAQETERPMGGAHNISNTELITNTEEETNTLSENEKLIPEVIDLFKNLNPAYQRLFGRVNQRESCQRMLEIHGMEKIQFAIKYLEHCVTNSNKYCPVITTPLELEDKWGKLQFAYSKERVGTQKGGVYKI